eukprot:TRINITY_DN10040_c0_g1_i1.p1 TRINITY_DN10040_c0_g1~~TRINITY_DN10040_c0_g1_i1.p1  ORF type:complete len:669 (+),score=170.42 TRINITY_DN10040_c0_g1_i1:90-2096(+)
MESIESVPFSELFGKLIAITLMENAMEDEEAGDFLPRTDETYRIPKSSYVDIDAKAVQYLDKLVHDVLGNNILPLKVPQDGNCLLHALSVAMWGPRSSYHALLRELLCEELEQNEEFYRNSVDKTKEDQESQGYSKVEFDRFLAEAKSTHAFLSFFHIFALSNILKRPIIVYASSKDETSWGIHEEGCAGTFLPTRHGATQCCAEPITLAWGSGKKNHYIPLCQKESVNWEIPILDVVFKKTLKPGETVQLYLAHGKLNQQRKSILSITEVPKPDPVTTDPDDFLTVKLARTGRSKIIRFPYKYSEDSMEIATKFIKAYDLSKDNLEQILEYLEYAKAVAKLTNPQKNPTRTEKKVPFFCPLIPFPGPYHLISVPPANIPNIGNRILKINQELKTTQLKKPLNSKLTEMDNIYLMDEQDIAIFQSFISLLSSPTPLSIPNEPLFLLTKILSWPIDQIFPVIDLARLVILNPSAANYYYQTKDQTPANIFTLLLHITSVPEISYECKLMTLRFIVNLFGQECLHNLLIKYSKEITSILMAAGELNVVPKEKQIALLKVIGLACVNYATLWKGGQKAKTKKDHNLSLHSVLSTCFKILSTDPLPLPEDVLQNMLIAVGTILQKDARIKISMGDLEVYLSKVRYHPSKTISALVTYIYAIVESPATDVEDD